MIHVLLLIIADVVALGGVWVPGIANTISSGILSYLTSILVLYIIYYWIMKIIGKDFLERPCVFIATIIAIIIFICCISIAFNFWRNSPINPNKSPSVARIDNKDCVLFNYFDDHDLWHISSSFGLFFLFLGTFMVDENMIFVPRDKIRVI